MKVINEKLNYSRHWELPDVYLFTGNGTVKSNGALVMGRGAAKAVRDAYPGIDKVFGDKVKHTLNIPVLWAELQLNPEIPVDQYIGWFKVKREWFHPADPELIQAATGELYRYAVQEPQFNYHMNYPGIGNGGLPIEVVQPIVEILPDNVFLYL